MERTKIYDHLLVTLGCRAGTMDMRGDIDLPYGTYGEDDLAEFAAHTVDSYLLLHDDDISFDEYIETALLAKYGKPKVETKTITGYFIDPENGIAEPRAIEHSLDSFYALLRCSCIDIPSRTIGNDNDYFDIICDDEGVLKDAPIISALDKDGSPALVGPLFVVKYDGGEDITSLTPAELSYVERYVVRIHRFVDSDPRPSVCLTGLGY